MALYGWVYWAALGMLQFAVDCSDFCVPHLMRGWGGYGCGGGGVKHPYPLDNEGLLGPQAAS